MMVYWGFGNAEDGVFIKVVIASMVYWGCGNAEDAVFNKAVRSQMHVCGEPELHTFLFRHTDLFVAPKLASNRRLCENKKSV
jgi:hypothetical protein